MNNNLLKITEFSEFSFISRKSLIYYDEIGILKPIYKNDKGYRYYNKQQVYQVMFIRILQDLNYSLNDIKNILHTPKSYEIESVVQKQLDYIDVQMKQLLTLKSTLSNQLNAYRDFSKNEFELKKVTIEKTDFPKIVATKNEVNLNTITFSSAIHQILGNSHSISLFPNGIKLSKNENDEWMLCFYKETSKRKKECLVWYTNDIREIPIDTLDHNLSNLSKKYNIKLTNSIFIEAFFSDVFPNVQNNLIYKIMILID